MEKTMNFAIIGCGVIGPTHALSIVELPGTRLVAVCDIIQDRARNLAQRFSAYGNPVEAHTDYNEMLRRDDIDVVNVATPSGLHAQVGMAVARAGKHVIVEKPMDITLAKADALIKTCQAAGVKLCCISQHRFDQATKELKKAVEEKKLGQLNFGGAYTQWYRTQEYYDSGDWRGTWSLDGGGALMNQSIHYVDLLQYIMGPVVEVHAFCATRAHTRIEVEDTAVAALKFKSGALGVIEGMTSAYPGYCARLEVYGSDGGITIENDLIKDWQLRCGEKPAPAEEIGNLIVGTSSAEIWQVSHRRQVQEMIQAIREDRDPLVNGAEGRKPLALILAIYESARTGKPVKL